MASSDIRLILTAEADLDAALKARCGALLHEVFGNPHALERGFNHTEPLYRVLAFAGTELVAQRNTCRVGNDQGLDILGFGDLAVREPYRRRGLARAMTAQAVAEGLERGPDALLTMTVVMASVYRELGFQRARAGMFLLCEPGRPAREEDPWVRWTRPERERPARYRQQL